jgi:fumarylacetoacetase
MAVVPIPLESDFTLANLPYGVFRPRDGRAARLGVALGEYVVDLSTLADAGLLDGTGIAREVFGRAELNGVLAAGRSAWQALRQTLQHLVGDPGSPLHDPGRLRAATLHLLAAVDLQLPVTVGDYTDFYASRHHASNVGAMLRDPNNPLLPNWLHLPVAYHGRASSIVPSGTTVHRPCGQYRQDGALHVGPSQAVDYELEVGAIIGAGNPLGQPIPIDQAEDHIFGLVLVNDWSARDLQAWEYQPLGPFLAKNFATTISPWVVPLAALAPFRVPLDPQDPLPPEYLRATQPLTWDITLEAVLTASSILRHTLCNTNLRHLYWSLAQMIAHHTINGCNLRPGDLLATGTISGPTPASRGCLLERTWRGSEPITLSDGSIRRYLDDGDTVTLRGHAGQGGQRVGFGECSGQLIATRLT